MEIPAHPDAAPLAFLIGTWRGDGMGSYPGIDSFTYLEEVVFGHTGKPFLTYTQRTRHATTGMPLHAEAGFFRPAGPGMVELVLAQPSGIVEIHTGTVEGGDGGGVVDLASVLVATAPSAKPVTEVRRRIEVAGDELGYTLAMAAVGQPLQHHLEARLRRSQDGRTA